MDTYRSRIIESLSAFPPISLEEMDSVRLMNRCDTKYYFRTSQLPGLLDAASKFYRVMSIKDCRIFRYNTLYYDTPGLKTYLDHHNGIRPRYKVRFREYEETGSLFLEVKRKNTNERTRKTRISLERMEDTLSEHSVEFIEKNSPLNAAELIPSLWTIFKRITLVGEDPCERITLDTDLSFRSLEEGKALPHLTICEVKRNRLSGTTRFMQILKSAHIHPGSCSKYCLGSLLLKHPIKYNRFKSHILFLNKLDENVGRPYIVAG
jgi:hypothetical protein